MRFLMRRGDTVKLTAVFRDWGGELVNPDNVGLKIYNARQVEVYSASLSDMDAESLGSYCHFYTPENDGFYIYEFSGTLDGNTVLRRKDFEVKFV